MESEASEDVPLEGQTTPDLDGASPALPNREARPIRFRKWSALLWPLGGTLLGLFVVPIAIEQYPEIFKESEWILPVTMGAVAMCFIVPLLFHERVLRAWRWSRTWLGVPLAITVVFVLAGLSFDGIRGLYRLHIRHLDARLNKSTETPKSAVLAQGSPSKEASDAGPTHPKSVVNSPVLRPPSKSKPKAVVESSPQPQTVLVQTAPVYGNIAERANSLANDIMDDLYSHGWPGMNGEHQPGQMPTVPEESIQWNATRSAFFRWEFLPKVIAIRDEFAQLHIQNVRLEQFLESERMEKNAANRDPGYSSDLLPMQIEFVADELRSLARQVPTQSPRG